MDSHVFIENAVIQDNLAAISGLVGRSSGGAIRTLGNLDVANSTFQRNTATSDGGAILVESGATPKMATIQNSVFDRNFAGDAPLDLGVGGAIFVDGRINNNVDMTLTDVTFSNNQAGNSGGGVYFSSDQLTVNGGTYVGNNALGSDGGGGGLYVLTASRFDVDSVTFTDNSAVQGAGGFESVDTAGTIQNSVFQQNRVTGTGVDFRDGGGGIAILSLSAIAPQVTISNVNVDQNTAPNAGGIALVNALVTIEDSVISANQATGTATSSAGGIGAVSDTGSDAITIQRTRIVGNTADVQAGGLGTIDTSVNLIDSEVDSNEALNDRAGGIGLLGINFVPVLTAVSSTIVDNNSSGDGAGLAFDEASFSLTNVTVAGNRSGGGSGGGLAYDTSNSTANSTIAFSTFSGNASDGNSSVIAAGTPIDVQASIFAGQGLAANPGVVVSQGFNVDLQNTYGFNDPTDQVNTDPLLGTLANNGGDVRTIAVLAGSPAIDVVNGGTVNVPPNDARGITRPIDGDGDASAFADAGAFEAPAISILTLGGTVFNDFSPAGGGTNDGVLNNGEGGIVGAEVSLFIDDGSLDFANDQPVATTITDNSGNYQFANLVAGNYAAVIAETEFQNGRPLFGFSTSTGNSAGDPTVAPDPDDDVDGDDNGLILAGVGIVSELISLTANNEPINDGDADANTNFSLDIGVAPQVDLSISTTLNTGQSNIVPGGTAIFDVVVTNSGPAAATGVTITDVIPAGLTFDGPNSNFNGLANNFDVGSSTLTVDVGNLASGTNATITLATTIDAGASGSIVNTATVTGEQVETTAGDNSGSATVALASADVSISIDDNTTTDVPAGSALTYTITVTNNGPDMAAGVVVANTLPASTSFFSGTSATGSATFTENPNGTLTINVGALSNGASEVLDVTVLVDADSVSPIVNQVAVTLTPDIDTNTTNDTAQVSTNIVRNVDVGVDKQLLTANVVAGQNLTYAFVVSNSGPGVARDVTVFDTLDNRLTFSSFDAGTSGANIIQANQDLTFDVGTLAVGESRTFFIDATVNSSATTTISNTASVTTTDIDTNALNDQDTVDANPNNAVDLVLTNTVDLANAVPGQDALVYTFVVSHDIDSTSDAANVTVTNVLPSGLIAAIINAPTATTTAFNVATQTATIGFDSLPVGEMRTFTITANVAEDAIGTLTNTATLSIPATELDTTNNTASAATNLSPAFDVTVSNIVDNANPSPGANVTYTVGLNNAGPSTATGILLTNTIPSGLTFVSGDLNGLNATSNGTTVSFPLISLAAATGVTATLVFSVDATAAGSINSTATVAADAGEIDATNNSATSIILQTMEEE